MMKAQLAPAVIAATMDPSDLNFDLSPGGLITLKQSTEGWPDIRLPPGTGAELIDADRGVIRLMHEEQMVARQRKGFKCTTMSDRDRTGLGR